MITKEEYEKALTTIENFENQCSKCKNQLKKSNPYRNSFEINIDTNSTDPLRDFWGNGNIIDHPAVKTVTTKPEKIMVYAGINREYQLCDDCHKELMQLISGFILNKTKELHIIVNRQMHGYEAIMGVFETFDEALESEVWSENDEIPDVKGNSENFYIYETKFN